MTRCFRSSAIGLVLMLHAGHGLAQDGVQDLATRARIAVQMDDLAALKQVVAEGADLASVEEGRRNLITIAAVRASVDMLAYLAEQGVDFDLADERCYTPVMRALERARIDNALKLRDLGASLEGVTSDGYTVRVLAEVAGLPDFGPEPPGLDRLFPRDVTNDILLKAAEFGDIAIVKLALDNGADVAAAAANGWTAIMIAALAGRVDIVELLAEKGALGARDEPPATVGENVDVVVAALIGKGNGNPASVDAILGRIAAYKELGWRSGYYRTVAARQGYEPDFIERHFPLAESAYDLPPLEFDLPLIGSNDPDSWKELQRDLRKKGLYDGAIDGVPGHGTFSALYGYLSELEPLLVRRSVTASARARNLLDQGATHPAYGRFMWSDPVSRMKGRDERVLDAFGQARRGADVTTGAGYYAIGIGRPGEASEKEVQYGYFSGPDSAGPFIEGFQISEDHLGFGRASERRELILHIAGGWFLMARYADKTALTFSPAFNEVSYESRFEDTNDPLPLEPLPGADLMDRPRAKSVAAGSKDIIIDAYEDDDFGSCR